MKYMLGISAGLQKAPPLFPTGGSYWTCADSSGCITHLQIPQHIRLGADLHFPIVSAGVTALASAPCARLLQVQQMVPGAVLQLGVRLLCSSPDG